MRFDFLLWREDQPRAGADRPAKPQQELLQAAGQLLEGRCASVQGRVASGAGLAELSHTPRSIQPAQVAFCRAGQVDQDPKSFLPPFPSPELRWAWCKQGGHSIHV